MANVPSMGLRADEIKPIAKRENGHDSVTFIGGKNAHFTKTFSRDVRRAEFKSPGDYERASRDNMSRIAEVVPSRIGRPSAPRSSVLI